jgi:hypothetical protein
MLRAIQDIVIAGLRRHGLAETVLELDTHEGRLRFITSLPSLHVGYEMRATAHDNRDFRPKIGDMEDISALSVATAYCDAVVTEKMWGHILRQSRVNDVYGAVVLRDIKDLAPLLCNCT